MEKSFPLRETKLLTRKSFNVKTLKSSIDGNRNFQIEKGVNAENFYKFQYITIDNI